MGFRKNGTGIYKWSKPKSGAITPLKFTLYNFEPDASAGVRAERDFMLQWSPACYTGKMPPRSGTPRAKSQRFGPDARTSRR